MRESVQSQKRKKLRFITQHQFDEICRKRMCALMGLRSISVCTVNVNRSYIDNSHPKPGPYLLSDLQTQWLVTSSRLAGTR